MKRWWLALAEPVLVVAIFAAGVTIGSRYMSAYQEMSPEDQDLAPAVLAACGHGFVQPSNAGPTLRDFLHRERADFSCSELPEDITPIPLDLTQRLYQYLMTAVSWQWRWPGISWRGLAPLFGVLFGLTLCAAYGLFRLAGGPAAGVLGAIVLAVSAHHLGALPQLRDYAKAPFILFLILAGAHLAAPPLKPRRSLLLAALIGLLLGIGFGFRNDILINVPPLLAVVFLLTPGKWRENMRLKVACTALAAGLFFVSAWPILSAYGSGSNTGHVAVLGLMSSFDDGLGLTRPPYELGQRYLDSYAATVIVTHEQVRDGRSVEYLTPEYEAAGFHLIGEVFRSWPADIFVRGLASTSEVLDFPFTFGRHPYPPGLMSDWTKKLYEWQREILRRLAGAGLFCALVSILILGARDLRIGIALLVMLFYYCGYPAVQFDIRHYFHLEFIAWWMLAFVIATMCRATWRLVAERRWPRPSLVWVRNAGITAVVVVAMVTVPSVTLRAYQQRHLANLFESYLALPRTPVPALESLWKDRNEKERWSVRYLVAEFRADDCRAADLPLSIKYDASSADSDFSYVTRIPVSAKGATVTFVPAYYGPQSHFHSLVLPSGYEHCLKSVSRIDRLSDVPLIVDLTLAPDWRTQSLFQRLVKWEAEPSAAKTLVLPEDLVLPEHVTVRGEPFKADQIGQGVAVNSSEHRWFTSEAVRVAESRQLLLQFPAQDLPTGTALSVRGTVRRGGLRIVTTQNGRGIDSRAPTSAGPFRILLGVPSAGAYGVSIVDESEADWRREPKSLLRAGVSGIAPWVLADDFELDEIAWVAAPR